MLAKSLLRSLSAGYGYYPLKGVLIYHSVMHPSTMTLISIEHKLTSGYAL